jgi:RNA recognition motif-containing protein
VTRLYVGNIPRETTEAMLRTVLERDGRTVTQVNIKRNATSGKPRGFAFVDMGSPEDAAAAIAAAHGTLLGDHTIKVNHAKELAVRSAADQHGTGSYFPKRGGRR